MNIDQTNAEIDMFFGYRFGVALGWVLEGVWEAKNLDFGSFFEQKSKAKKHDVLEGSKEPSRRRKKQPPEPLSKWEGAQVEAVLGQVACRGGRGGTTKNQKLVIQHALGPKARRISKRRPVLLSPSRKKKLRHYGSMFKADRLATYFKTMISPY